MRLAILPQELSASSEAQSFLRLPHPRSNYGALFLPYTSNEPPLPDLTLPATPAPSRNPSFTQQDGLLEVQAIAPPDDQKRSWFVDEQVVSDGKLFILTPFDPMFLLVAILLATQQNHSNRSLPYSDIFEDASTSYQFAELDKGKKKEDDEETRGAGQDVVTFGNLPCVRRAAEKICEVKEIAPDLFTYRLSMSKLLVILRAKIERLGTEECFASDKYPTLGRLLAREGLGDGEGIGADVIKEARQKTALDVIVNYLPPSIEQELKNAYVFPALQTYLDRINVASSLSSDHISGLPTPPPDAGPSTKSKPMAGAKGKKKAASKNSKGVDALAKVSTRGMKPLTTFFSKSPSPSPTPPPEKK